MNLELPCEKCNRLLSVPTESLGKQVQCGACGYVQTARMPPAAAIQPDEPVTLQPVIDVSELARPVPDSDSEGRITREPRRPQESVRPQRKRFEDEEDNRRSGPIDCPYCQERIASSAEECRMCGRSLDPNLVEADLVRLRMERRRQDLLALAFGIPGFFVFVGGSIARVFLKGRGLGHELLAYSIVLLGTALLLVGCVFFAKHKGQHPALGLLVFGGCIGLIVLHAIEDKKAKQIRRLKRFIRDY